MDVAYLERQLRRAMSDENYPIINNRTLDFGGSSYCLDSLDFSSIETGVGGIAEVFIFVLCFLVRGVGALVISDTPRRAVSGEGFF